ncbi:MAG: hypothetical protein ACO3N9_12600, partial [Alphaproteobacteria bacterium]
LLMAITTWDLSHSPSYQLTRTRSSFSAQYIRATHAYCEKVFHNMHATLEIFSNKNAFFGIMCLDLRSTDAPNGVGS